MSERADLPLQHYKDCKVKARLRDVAKTGGDILVGKY